MAFPCVLLSCLLACFAFNGSGEQCDACTSFSFPVPLLFLEGMCAQEGSGKEKFGSKVRAGVHLGAAEERAGTEYSRVLYVLCAFALLFRCEGGEAKAGTFATRFSLPPLPAHSLHHGLPAVRLSFLTACPCVRSSLSQTTAIFSFLLAIDATALKASTPAATTKKWLAE